MMKWYTNLRLLYFILLYLVLQSFYDVVFRAEFIMVEHNVDSLLPHFP